MGLLNLLRPGTGTCEHLEEIERAAAPRADRCEECGSHGSIRVCLTCGHVGCCDSSLGHATAHARETGHPVIRSLPLSDRSFTYCYQGHGYL